MLFARRSVLVPCLTGCLFLGLTSLPPVYADKAPLASKPLEDRSGLDHVILYSETLLEHARDTYGSVKSPLFATTLNKKTLKLYPKEDYGMLRQIRLKDWENWGIRNADRNYDGANPMRDQNLYQILYALTEITGDARYAQEADRALKWFFENCQSPATGLLAWGEHLGWSFLEEKHSREVPHEFARPWVLWKRSFELAPEACEKFARGLWEHQVADHETGDFSRHADYAKHKTGLENGYPRHGGFFIATWAEAYSRSKDPLFLKAISKLVDLYNNTSEPRTGIIPCSTNPGRFTIAWPESNLSLAVDLWDSAEKVPEELARKMRLRALRTDAVFLSLTHDFSPGGKGFVAGANTETLARLVDSGWTDSDMWATSYGKPTDAQVALICYLRYRQIEHVGYRNLVLGAATRYLSSDPERTSGLHPGTLGQIIQLLLRAFDITSDEKFSQRADYFAKMAVQLFLHDSPLPAATVTHRHYEANSGADTLMVALLELWTRQTGRTLKTPLTLCDR